jgi:ADP-dependent phosphofructokinase/glucokinase
MQNVKDAAAQAGLGADLAGLPPGVTVHTELSGGVVSAWYLGILTRYVHSLGVNAEELADACACVAALQCAADTLPQDSGVPGLQQEYLLRLAAWLLEHLALERIYIHGHTLDFVVRWAETSDEEMAREVRADLLAKIVVTNKARGRNPGEPIARPLGLPRSGLAEYVDLCELRAFPVGEWIEQASMAEFERILDRGWFESAFVEADRERVLRVAVLPVALFHPLPPELRFVGAGDTTSAVSFIYSCFTAASALRAAQPRDVAGQPA